ncbi:MAG: AAA family ATPase [Candidatus Omnitrophica bacterium]|nr:AAA family ATPase [Candidatus Omnitrophota bacterium]
MTATRAKKQLFLNYKGGTGKTSISSAYGYCLAHMGKRVLMVDLDAQAHLTTCLNQEGLYQDKSLYSVMVKGDNIADVIRSTSLPSMKLIPSTISLSALEVPLFRMHLREFRLRQVLKSIEKDYDFIIIDSAPSINLLSLNAILASDEILIPLLADFLSFHGLKILMETLASIENDFSFYLGKIHIFLNRFNPGYQICGECKEAVHKFYPEYALQTVISESHEIIDASSVGKSVFELHPESKVASDIMDLVYEVNKESLDETVKGGVYNEGKI